MLAKQVQYKLCPDKAAMWRNTLCFQPHAKPLENMIPATAVIDHSNNNIIGSLQLQYYLLCRHFWLACLRCFGFACCRNPVGS